VTVDEIRQIAQLSHHEKMLEEARNYPYVGKVIRRVSPYFTKFFVDANLSANQVSSLSILFGVIGGLLFAFGNYYLMIIGCIVFFHLWNLLDCVDGEVARVTNDLSLGGNYLEEIHNPLIESLFMACFGIGLFTLERNIAFLYLGFTFGLSICLVHTFNRTRSYIAQSENEASYTFPLSQKKSMLSRAYSSLYRKVRLLFLLPNTYLILTCLLVFDLIFPVKLSYTFYGVTFNLVSAYFVLYGIDWLARTVISAFTNYRYLMRANQRLKASQPTTKNDKI
jgi:phosphatidylglycerophosphate synthase